MIVWCAYCQTFQGERPPLDDFAITHGVCDACMAKGALQNDVAIAAIRPLSAFYRRLRSDARTGAELSTPQIMDEARALGIRGVDLLWGMLQPILYEIGALWASGEVTIAIEHRLTMNAARIVDAVARSIPAPSGPPEFLLVNAEGNDHTLGVRVLEVLLRDAGHSTYAVVPGLPPREVVALAQTLAPKVIGVSVALAEHASSLDEITRGVAGWANPPRVLVGGHAVKMGLVPDLGPLAVAVSDARTVTARPSR